MRVNTEVTRDVPWLSDVSPGEMRRIIDVLCRVHHFLADITDLNTLLESIMEQSKQVANIVILGASMAITRVVTKQALISSIREHVAERFKESNLKALEVGFGLGQSIESKL